MNIKSAVIDFFFPPTIITGQRCWYIAENVEPIKIYNFYWNTFVNGLTIGDMRILKVVLMEPSH
jgi:hypothetical protein